MTNRNQKRSKPNNNDHQSKRDKANKRKKTKNIPVLIADLVDGNYMVIAEKSHGTISDVERACKSYGFVENGDIFDWPAVNNIEQVTSVHIGYIIRKA